MRKGWFIIPDVQDGDRTLEEQMLGVSEALPEAVRRSVLDIGCAEGLIGREFIRAGAIHCHGLEAIADHIAVAQEQCAGLPMTFAQVELYEYAMQKLQVGPILLYDVVLALGVCHKLADPGIGIRFAARSTGDLLLVRMHARSEAKDGLLRSKFAKQKVVNTIEIMTEEGFEREKILPGPKDETVWYWRRK